MDMRFIPQFSPKLNLGNNPQILYFQIGGRDTKYPPGEYYLLSVLHF
jgi:hypothetical protein